jgi:hypothetical protein
MAPGSHVTALALYCLSAAFFWLAAETVAAQVDPPLAGPDLRNLPQGSWVKLSPLTDTPPSPRLGYEGACAWDSRHELLIRYGGHNQGGGGEQGSEIWTFDPRTARWTLKEPNTSPPGICCGQQNVFDPVLGRYIRFPAFSASHGWQWRREVYLNDASLWTYDLAANEWRNMRPLPAAHPRPLRCAAWDSDHQVIVICGGEGSREGTWVYDPWTNSWTRMNPSTEPAERSGGNMAYDARHQVHILFGAQFTDDPHTWAYDLRTNTWRDMRPAVMPPTEKNDAVLTYDSAAGVVLAIVKVTSGSEENSSHRLETWSYDYGANRWTKMSPQREPDPTGNRARQLIFAPELGLSLLENRPSSSRGLSEQQIWAFRSPSGSQSVSTELRLPPPIGVIASTHSDRVVLAWRPHAAGQAASFSVYRGTGERPWAAQFAKVASVNGDVLRYEDHDVSAGQVQHYFLRAVDRSGREGPASLRVRTQPRAIDRLVVSVHNERRVEIAWNGLPSDDIAGYQVERAAVEVLTDDQLKRLKGQTPPLAAPSVGAIRRVGSFTRLTSDPIASTTFVDTSVDLAKPEDFAGEPLDERRFGADDLDAGGRPYRYSVYAYRVRAVNRLGVAGGPSPAVLTIPSSPQWLFSKEVGTTCQLKWQPNQEHGIQGYRVYRLDGRYDKDPIARLIDDPIPGTTFADPAAGKSTRRYYVVAVDALGQEGFPSSPVWFQREWRSFYVPFVGEWHQ